MTRDIIAELKALRLHGMAATWAELTEQNSGEIEGLRWVRISDHRDRPFRHRDRRIRERDRSFR